MPLTSGAHHLALFTEDMDRLIAFYTSAFDASVSHDLTERTPDGSAIRHAMVGLGGGFCLHVFQMPKPTGFEAGSSQMGQRGHLDHLALRVESEAALQDLRRRLVAAKASNGTVTDYGAIRLIAFTDPDGMEGEVALWTASETMRQFHERTQEPWTDPMP